MAIETALELVIDANVIFALAFALWWVAQRVLTYSRYRTDYGLQLRLLRTVLLFVIFSPFISYGLVIVSQSLWPDLPITASDIAVAAYLRGDIALPALQFEQLLTARSRIIEGAISGELFWLTAIFAAIGLSSAVIIGQIVCTVLRIRSIVLHSYVWRRTRTTDILLSDTVEVPFATRGLFRRKIVLPSRLLVQPKDLRIVLAHEFEHLREGDAEWEFVLEFMRPILFWNPVFLLWKHAFSLLRELNCDRAVLTSLRITPREYAHCLLDFCGRRTARGSAKRLNVALVRTGGRDTRYLLETRLLALREQCDTQPNHGVFWALTVCVAGCLLLAAALFHSPSDWSQDRLMLSTIVNLERLEAINRGF